MERVIIERTGESSFLGKCTCNRFVSMPYGDEFKARSAVYKHMNDRHDMAMGAAEE